MNHLPFAIYHKILLGLVCVACCLAFFLPSLVAAQENPPESQFDLIVCGEDDNQNNVLDPNEECTYSDLVELVSRLIKALVFVSTFLATAVFAWAGFILLTSGGNPSAKTKAKDMFVKVLIGYLWILAAWLVVYTITNVLLKEGYSLLK